MHRPRWGSRSLCFLYAHFVFDDQRTRLERLARELQNLGEFIPTDAAVQMCRRTLAIDGRYFHLSFDDGLRNILTNAAPILHGRGIPFTTFVNPSMAAATFEETVRHCGAVNPYPAPVEHMTWDDMRELVRAGGEIGSHARTHRPLTPLVSDGDMLRSEIQGSKRDIEEALGRPCRYFALPFAEDNGGAIEAAVSAAGYDAAFGAGKRLFGRRRTSRFVIPRRHVEVHWPWRHIELLLSTSVVVDGR